MPVSALSYSFFQIGKTKTPYCSFANVLGNVLPDKLREKLLPATYNQIAFEEDPISAVQSAGHIIPRGETMRIQEDAWTNWPLHGYFARFFNISLEAKKSHRYFFMDGRLKGQEFEGYQQILTLGSNYTLYRLSDRSSMSFRQFQLICADPQ